MSAESPPYTITDTIIDKISPISKLLGQITAEDSLNKQPRLRKINRIKSIHSSLAIENNTLTLSQVTDIINGKAVIGPYNEILEVKNAGKAYDLLETLNPYEKKDLLTAHKTLMEGLTSDAGVFRTCGVGVFSGETCIHLAPPAQFVPSQIQNLLDWAKETPVHPLIKSSVFHFELEFIHPFTDGNGRIGRLWQTLILRTWDKSFSWIPIETLILGRQEEYYKALSISGKSGTSTPFIEFMLETIEQALLSRHYDTINEIEETIIHLIQQNPKITIDEIIKYTGNSRSTITRALSTLKKKNIITRIGANKNGYWKVSL